MTIKSYLFNPGSVHGNVDLNKRHNSAVEFGFYADSFREAAHHLTQNLEESYGYSDLDACPIAFLYRHALELYFKSIILIGADILKLQSKNLTDLYSFTDIKNSKNIFTEHSLKTLFRYVIEILDANKLSDWPEEEGIPTREEANQIVDDLETFDNKSFAFRYPTDKVGNPHLVRKIMFNIIDFSHLIQQFCEFMEMIYLMLSEIFNNQCEYFYNQHNNC